jgi:hypothetical protein
MPLLPNRWAVLRLRSSGPQIEWRYSDSLGRVRRLSWDAKEFAVRQAWPPPPGSRGFSEFTGLIGSLAEGMPSARWGPGTTPVPVAVFIELPPEVSFADLERQSIFGSDLDPQALQFVQLPRTRRFRRSPFELPLNVFAVGPESPRALTQLEESSWYARDPVVREFGLRIQTAEQSSSSRLKEAQSDILLADASSPVLRYLSRLPAARRPRLLVALDRNFNEPFRVQVPAGVAVLRLPDISAGENVEKYLRAFTYGILHDFPLHGALQSASLEVHPQFEPLLIADPTSNQSLRMEDALSGLKRQTERLEATLPELDFDSLLKRVAQASDPDWQDRLPALQKRIFDLSGGAGRKQASDVRSLLSSTKSLPFYFAHESDSVVPMASARAEFAEVTKNEPTIQKAVEKLVADDNVAALLKSHQQRFLDLALARLETEPLLQSLTRSDTLGTGKSYQLRVHVGNRTADSIVTGPDVPVDPILPAADQKGRHQLEIAVQGKDFEVLSDRVQTAWLPEFGATEPVYFQIRAPKDLGTKQMRVCLYCKNYLIQSYRFTAEVTSTESPVREEGKERLGATLEFSRTDHFSDLEEFQPRALSVGVNSGNSTTHEIIVKSDNNISAELTLFALTFDPEVQKFRDTLEKASRDPANPKLTRVYPQVPPGQVPGDDVAQTLRDLAKQGRGLYESVFGKVDQTPLRPALVEVAMGSDKKLQVIRFDDNFVFPWVIIYDFPLPVEIVGQKAAPVCLGVTADASGKPVQCGHTSETPAYCVRGFWGVRHYVEEMIGKGTNTNPKISKTASGAVRIVADTTLVPSTTLITNLSASLGSTVVSGPLDPDKLLDLLWANPPQRPSILVVLGHLAKRSIKGEPDGARIVLVPNSKWLLRQKIAERYTKDPIGWRQPRSIVLLMACESAATEVATVNDFVTAWNAAGAGAIVGTECVVGADLAASLAESVTTDLWNGKTLGEAMTNFRRGVLTRGNPLGLVFHAIGDVDLTVN